MLKHLFIQNYAIINEIDIEFSPRMNVITGETGAGKSIIMGALSLILGDRADTSILLDHSRKCIVEGTFEAAGKAQVQSLIRELDLQPEDDSTEVVIRREIAASGKSRAFVNDVPLNLEQLRQVSSLLVDLHRQFDTLTLSDSTFQLGVLDALAGNAAFLQQYQDAYRKWRTAADELALLQAEKNEFNKEFDYHKFLYDELEEAGFHENELEDAENELKLLSNAEAIKQLLSAADEQISGGGEAIVSQLRSLKQQIDSYASVHARLGEIAERLQSVYLELKDIGEEVGRLNDDVVYDPQRIQALNERLTTGYKLLKKHGVKTTAELTTIMQELERKLQAVLNIDERIAEKEKETEAYHKHVLAGASRLSDKRSARIKFLETEVNKLLQQVGMPNAKLKVMLAAKSPDATGSDNVEFLFDANKSNRFEPLRKVASGGELSRLMLSIKSLVAESMDMPTLIFDEIDTGISGEAARQVGMIMHALTRNRQVITITHQPQIAGRAHAHLFVYKENKKENITTNIRVIEGEERVTAIAKMLSGEKPTAAALENAREMVLG